jgi:putative Mg2+ transporter-C (MgtC) family protein
VRALLAQVASRSKFRLRALQSEDLELASDRVRVVALLHGFGPDDVALEEAVSRLSLEPSVSAVRWSVEDSEHAGGAET